jgi:hypothetical protein
MIRAIIIGALFASPALAQPQCAPTDAVAANLMGQYGETIQASGIAANGTYVMWWGNTETGTWTVTASNAQGMTCLVAHGDAFDASRQAPAPTGERS